MSERDTPTLRRAAAADLPAVARLIEDSVRGLSAGYYSPAEVDSALRHLFGADSQLVRDGTYFVVDGDGASGAALAAAGGWSGRRTLYGGDQAKDAEDPMLDPATDAARIRAFFVHPAHARRGLGRLLFERCRDEARRAGFRRLELLATLPGEPLYAALGFTVHERIVVPLPDGLALRGAVMTRPIDDAPRPQTPC